MNLPPPSPGGSYPQPPPGWQPSPVPPPGYYYAQGRTSGLAVASMVLGIVWIYWLGSILAVIFGHIAISQTRRDPTLRGKGMAIAGLVLGYVGIGVFLLAMLFVVTARSV